MSANIDQELAGSLRLERAKDKTAIDTLMAVAFGKPRHSRSVRHLRLCAPVAGLCFVIEHNGLLVGSIRYWPILVAGKKQLLLGPLAVDPEFAGRGYGKALVSHSLDIASQLDYDFALISGEADYYPRFGFVPASFKQFLWPGFIEPERLQIKWFHASDDKAVKPTNISAILPITS